MRAQQATLALIEPCYPVGGRRYRVNRTAKFGQPLTHHQKAVNQSRAKVRARGDHPFCVVKHLWGRAKVRYRGLAKESCSNTHQIIPGLRVQY
jgi:hypothetical protein